MAEEKFDSESFLSRAKEQEQAYNWLGAAEFYKSALELLPKDNFLRKGQTQEERAYALFRAAMQAENLGEFKERLSETVAQYEGARNSYSEVNSTESSPRVSRCDAMMAYLGFWQTSEVAIKKKKVSEAWSHAKKAMDAFGQNEALEFGKTYNDLFLSAVFSLHLSDDQRVRMTILSEAIAYGEKAVELLSETENPDQLVNAHLRLAGLIEAEQRLSAISLDKQAMDGQNAAEHWRAARALSEEIALTNNPFAMLAGETLRAMDLEETQKIYQKQLGLLRKTRDRLAIGVTLGHLAYMGLWQSGSTENPEDFNALLEKSLQYVEDARGQFEKIGFVDPNHDYNLWVSSPSQPWCFDVQAFREMDLKRKRELYAEFLRSAMQELAAAEKSGFPCVVEGAHFLIGKALAGLAKTEARDEHKAKLLGEAVQHMVEASRLNDILMPSTLWNKAFLCCLIGQTELELAGVTQDIGIKKAHFDSSISHMREGLDMFQTIPDIHATQDATILWVMSEEWLHYGRALRSSYELTDARETMIESAVAIERAAGLLAKAGLPSRVAESLWEAAQTYDGLGEHLKASERFNEASEQYRSASDKIKSLGPLYKEQCEYMKAWSEIEKARHYHTKQEPVHAKMCYSKAAKLHESTGKWSFLSSNYLAWAQVENAEDLSQRERCKESIDAFREASKLFKDSKVQLQEQLAGIEIADEKQMVKRLIGAADQREELCKARIILEEARLLDKEGDLSTASEKYGLSADAFSKIKQGLTAEQDRREIDLIIALSGAWKAMAEAEAKSSPELYEEAAQFFDEAKDLSPGDRAKNLALGHSRLCVALGAGARYAHTSDSALHAAAAQNLESAAKYYLRADLQSAADYAKASKLLFDSYAFANRASSEEDQEKKTKLYAMAEKVLQASVSSYEKAGQPGRKEQALKILAKVKEDRELAMSLAEVFLAPDIVSTTKAFSSPTPTQEAAVGLERFEHADVQATLIAEPKELILGQEVSLEIELVNAGRGAAQLTRVDDAVPQGFDVVTAPEKCRIEASHLNMRGRRLDALKTEDVKLVLKPTAKGLFVFRPRVTYLDDSGKFKISEPQPVTITVKELGISGWLKGT